MSSTHHHRLYHRKPPPPQNGDRSPDEVTYDRHMTTRADVNHRLNGGVQEYHIGGRTDERSFDNETQMLARLNLRAENYPHADGANSVNDNYNLKFNHMMSRLEHCSESDCSSSRSSSCRNNSRPLPPPRPPDRKPPPSPQDQGYHTLPPWPGGNCIRTKTSVNNTPSKTYPGVRNNDSNLDIDTDAIINNRVSLSYDSSSDCNRFYYREYINHFDILPDEIVLKLFAWLSSEDLAKMAMTCRRFSILCWNPVLWECISLRSANDKMLKQIFHILCKSSFPKVPKSYRDNQSRFLDHHMRYIQPIQGCPYSEKCQNDLCRYDDACQSVERYSDGSHNMCIRPDDKMCSQYKGMDQYNSGFTGRNQRLSDICCGGDAMCCSKNESKGNICDDNLRSCLEVSRVMLSENCTVTDRGLSLIANKCPELTHLQVSNSRDLCTDLGVDDIVSACENLRHLDLTGCHKITRIQSPIVYVRTENSNGLQQNQNQSNSVLTNGHSHSHPSISHRVTPVLRTLLLQYLDLSDCISLDDNGLHITVKSCVMLTFLYLRRCTKITDAGVKLVPLYCSGLRELSLSDCGRGVTDFALHELAGLGGSLRYLSVAKCDRVSDAGLKVLSRRCYKLRYLNVRGCEAVSDDSIITLSRSCPRLRALDLGKCDVTDSGLRSLAECCPNLKKLSLRGCEMLTDESVRCVAYYCRGLRQLNIQGCYKVSIEGYRAVKKYCRRCVIEHSDPGFY